MFFFCPPVLQLIITYFLGSLPRRQHPSPLPLPTDRAGELSAPPAAAPCPRLTCLSPSLQPNESQTNDCASQELTIPPHLRSCFITAVSNVNFEDEAGEPGGKKRKKKKKWGSKTGQALIATYLGTDTLLFVPCLIIRLPSSPRKGWYSEWIASSYDFHQEQAQAKAGFKAGQKFCNGSFY